MKMGNRLVEGKKERREIKGGRHLLESTIHKYTCMVKAQMLLNLQCFEIITLRCGPFHRSFVTKPEIVFPKA